MADLKTIFVSEDLVADLSMENADLATDDGLKSAVILSLFTDARARPDDPLPGGVDDRRGWWGDAIPPRVEGRVLEGDRFGSRLWLLKREKIIPSVLKRAQAYAEEALAWLLESRIATDVTVTAEAQEGNRLALAVAITRTGGTRVDHRFAQLWEAT